MLTDFISIYENAISLENCKKWIEYIDYLRKEGLIIQENSKLHERDHETLNFSNDDAFDLNSSDKLVRGFLPSIKKYVDDYLQDYSLLGESNFLLYDVKAKRIPIAVDFINGTMKTHLMKVLLGDLLFRHILILLKKVVKLSSYIKIKELKQFKEH